MTLVFTVYGVAQPKGNMRAINIRGMKFPIVTDSNRNVKSWSQLVAQAASTAMQQLPEAERGLITDGVRLTAAFYLPRPKSLPKRPQPHTKAPDLDKLLRAIKDALAKVCYFDDGQVVELVALKAYAPLDDAPHVVIRVEPTLGIRPVVVPAAPQPLLEGML